VDGLDFLLGQFERVVRVGTTVMRCWDYPSLPDCEKDYHRILRGDGAMVKAQYKAQREAAKRPLTPHEEKLRQAEIRARNVEKRQTKYSENSEN
jgi:hypothetical protein